MSVIAVVGLATMGMNLARNLARNGFGVSIYNRTTSRVDDFMKQYGAEGAFTPAHTPQDLVAQLDKPRRILMMVKAGPPVDETIDHLAPHLEAGDILIDGGNSYFLDTVRRGKALEARGLRFIGTGVSGGEEGALLGPSIMPGGDRDAYQQVEPMLTMISAHVDGDPCCTYIGPGGAGHYVKMVHNGIEYADIQLIAEAYDLLTHALNLGAEDLSRIFSEWNKGDLESYLIQITSEVLAKRDRATGRPLVDVIVDEAEQKGTGKWASQSALDLGIPVTAITEAVFARSLSALKADRQLAARTLIGPNGGGKAPAPASLVDDVRSALYASKIVAYAQGFEEMQAASNENGWDLQLGAIARIWRGGCIIRARFLNRITDAYAAEGGIKNLLLVPYFRDAIASTQDAWRRVIGVAVERGIPVPAFSSSLAYYDAYRRERLPANLVQGLRDYFGAHTYRRIDRAGSFHTRWAQDGEEVPVR
ncbi:MAG: NADP-dependent phosphogluconate dehydrogenase [Chloroflexi bacterium]|nr:MAG: NADP-dependent phosphogluconate dehydrogenase [Chloroflexota bacterium]TMD21002.1 MAG: NADP-dependent phosphogluconate dehydrogenase [Chloroflexota bacterium]